MLAVQHKANQDQYMEGKCCSLWGFVFLGLIHGCVFLIFLYETVKKMIKSQSFRVGLFNKVSILTALIFAVSCLLAYQKIIILTPVPYLVITAIPLFIYFIQIILLRRA